MGTYANKIGMRGNGTNSATTAIIDHVRTVLYSNVLIDCFEKSGMLPVSNSEFSGQSVGRFVTSATANSPNETVVPDTSNVTGKVNIGNKVFKHPVLNIYVKVDICTKKPASSNSRLEVIYTIGRLINTAGFVNPFVVIETIEGGNTSSMAYDLAIPLEKDIYSSCGSDFFWIGGEGFINPQRFSEGSYATAFFPNYINPFALGIFSKEGHDDFVVISPSRVVFNGSGFASEVFLNRSTINCARLAATKMYAFNGVKYEDKAGYYPGYPEPLISTSSEGLRVYQGNAQLNGNRILFDYGLMPQAVIEQNALYALNFSGAGIRNYMGMKSFGTYADCGLGTNMNERNSIGMLLPWSD